MFFCYLCACILYCHSRLFFVLGTCTADCCRELRLTPFQPSDQSIIEKTRKQGKKYCQFSPAWYSTYPWLSLCITRAKAFCTYCRYCDGHCLLCLAKKGEDAFIYAGFDNWKKAVERYNQHVYSGSHREAVMKIELLKQDSIHALLCKHAMNDHKLHREMLIKQLSSLQYLLRQGVPIQGHDEMDGNLMQLFQLRSNDCPEISNWISERKYFSPDILNEQMALIGLSVLRDGLNEIRSANWFSLIVNEATDISNKEQLNIFIRWVDNNFEIHEDPIELIHVQKTDSTTLTGTIKDCLIRLCLPVSQCRGQAYDGASNMSGHLHGVAAQLQKEVPSALFVHCLAHCTNLCLQSVGRECVPVRDALDLVMCVSQLIRYSPKRMTLFQALQSQLAHGSASLKPLCPTRWTVRTGAIQSVLCNYSILCEALEQINAETRDEYRHYTNRTVDN